MLKKLEQKSVLLEQLHLIPLEHRSTVESLYFSYFPICLKFDTLITSDN